MRFNAYVLLYCCKYVDKGAGRLRSTGDGCSSELPLSRPHICSLPQAVTSGAQQPATDISILTIHHHTPHLHALQEDSTAITNLIPFTANCIHKHLTVLKQEVTTLASFGTILGSRLDPIPLLPVQTKTGRHSLPPTAFTTYLRHPNRPAARPFLRPSSPTQPRAWIPIWRMSGACLQILLLPLPPSPPPSPRSMAGLRA